MSCAIPYLTEYINCTCGMEERVGMDKVNTLWDECSEVDIGTVQPLQSEECLRQRCVSHVVLCGVYVDVSVDVFLLF